MRHGRRDLTHAPIRDGLRRYPGVGVRDLGDAGRGIPDLLVGYAGHNFLLEAKSGPDDDLTPDQVAFFAMWTGHRARVETLEQALAVIGYGVQDRPACRANPSPPPRFETRPAGSAPGPRRRRAR